MRVIAGEARGRSLRAPRGTQTRPTSDLMRGVIFSILDTMGVQPATVLDLYAGSGALGIEALSRGAGQAVFVERSPTACVVIRTNLEFLGFSQQARVLCASVAGAIGQLKGPYDVVFADPPYSDNSLGEILTARDTSQLWATDTVLIYEHARRDPAPESLGPLQFIRTRSHGSSSISFYNLGKRSSCGRAES